MGHGLDAVRPRHRTATCRWRTETGAFVVTTATNELPFVVLVAQEDGVQFRREVAMRVAGAGEGLAHGFTTGRRRVRPLLRRLWQRGRACGPWWPGPAADGYRRARAHVGASGTSGDSSDGRCSGRTTRPRWPRANLNFITSRTLQWRRPQGST